MSARAGILLLVLLPVAGGFAGYMGAPELARFHREVRLSELVASGSAGSTIDEKDALRAFRLSAGRPEELGERAAAIRGRFAVGSVLLGAWLGLVAVLKVVAAGRTPRRTEYEVDQAGCVGCARCYRYCPVERKGWKEAPPAGAPGA